MPALKKRQWELRCVVKECDRTALHRGGKCPEHRKQVCLHAGCGAEFRTKKITLFCEEHRKRRYLKGGVVNEVKEKLIFSEA